MSVDRICFVDCQQPVELCPCRQQRELEAANEALFEFLAEGGRPMEDVENDLDKKEASTDG